jgi:hypothetical protein
MLSQFTAIAYVWIALGMAYFLLRDESTGPWFRNGIVAWILSVAIIFTFRGSMGLSLLLLTPLILLLAPRPTVQKLPFCLLIFSAVPPFINAPIPFPAINYLISADFQLLVGLLVVLPALVSGEPNEYKLRPLGWATFLMILYIIVSTLLMFRVLPFTATVRFGAEAVLSFLLIYLLILHSAISAPVMERAIKAIYVMAIVAACIALLTQIKHWNFYSHADTEGRFFKAGEIRYGFLRTSATTIPALFGFFEAIGIILLLRQRELAARLPRYWWIIAPLLGFGFFVSLSRGAWLAGFVALGSYFLFKSRVRSPVIVFIIVIFSIALGYFTFSGGEFSSDLDPYQTFDYRKQLFITSWDQFLSAPLLGNSHYLDSGRFDELFQGEGIVDVVSVYLGLALQFGAVGLLLYLAPFLITLGGILKLRNTVGLDPRTATLFASLGGFLLGYLALISTVSGVSLVVHYGFILVGLANAAVIGHNLDFEPMRRRGPLSTGGGFQ